MNKEALLICPVCKEELKPAEKSYLCKNGHCFDIAKSGYVNLLQINHKKTKNPGDDKEMILARKHFLDLGYFEKLRNKIYEIIKDYSPATILDAGCGSGYYTNKLENEFQVISVDISKSAADVTAKNNKQSTVDRKSTRLNSSH